MSGGQSGGPGLGPKCPPCPALEADGVGIISSWSKRVLPLPWSGLSPARHASGATLMHSPAPSCIPDSNGIWGLTLF